MSSTAIGISVVLLLFVAPFLVRNRPDLSDMAVIKLALLAIVLELVWIGSSIH